MTAASLRHTLDDLARVPEATILEATTAVEDYAKRVGGRITIHRRKKGPRSYPLFAVTKFESDHGKTIRATVFGAPTGFWVWKTTGTRSHDIPARGRGQRFLFWSDLGHPIGFWVRHPGSPGRGRWKQVTRFANTEVPRILSEAVHDFVRKAA